MSDDDEVQRSPAEIQLALAKVAFRMAQLSKLVANQMSPKNSLLVDPNPQDTARRLEAISDEMMDIAGDLLGMDKTK